MNLSAEKAKEFSQSLDIVQWAFPRSSISESQIYWNKVFTVRGIALGSSELHVEDAWISAANDTLVLEAIREASEFSIGYHAGVLKSHEPCEDTVRVWRRRAVDMKQRLDEIAGGSAMWFDVYEREQERAKRRVTG